MRETLLGKLVMVLSRARPEELRAIYCFATGEGVSRAMGDAGWSMLDDRAKRGAVGAVAKGGVQSKPAYVFRWTGRDWEVVFGGGRAFHLPNVLGVRYANYLLHRPNGPISAFDLEVAVSPEKGEARARNSVQPASDTRALGEYRAELLRLQAKRKELEATGDSDGLEGLDNEVAALEAALTGSDGAADTGERAFDNVRKALRVVQEQLRSGGPEERAFAEHLRTHLSIGFECLYSQPEGRIWR